MSRSKSFKEFNSEMLTALNEELDDLYRRLDALESKKTYNFYAVVNTTETEVRHDLGRKPTEVNLVPRAAAMVGQTRPASETSVYLVANVQTRVDIYLK